VVDKEPPDFLPPHIPNSRGLSPYRKRSKPEGTSLSGGTHLVLPPLVPGDRAFES